MAEITGDGSKFQRHLLREPSLFMWTGHVQFFHRQMVNSMPGVISLVGIKSHFCLLVISSLQVLTRG